MNDPIQLNRKLSGNKFGLNPSRIIPRVRVTGTLEHNFDRSINKYITDTLKNNPYINNSQHKSIEVGNKK